MPGCERLTALDASFLDIEDSGTHMHVAAVLVFEAAVLTLEDGGLDIERIRSFVESRLHEVPRYRQKLAYTPIQGRAVWIDDRDFNIQYHVRHTSLPIPGDDRLLKRLAGRIMTQKLDRDKPLWELWVVEGLEAGRFALIIKVHHCMADGISALDMVATLLRPRPSDELHEPVRWHPRPVPSPAALAAAEVLDHARTPLAMLGRAWNAARDPRGAIESTWEVARALGETLAAGLRPASRTPLNPDHIGPHRRFDWTDFDLGAVKELKNRAGGTVNDVVLATVAGAVRSFLQARNVRVDDLEFRALIPVNLRSKADRGGSGNRVAMMLAPLPVGESDRRRRLRRVVTTTRRLKRSGQARGSEILGGFSNGAAPALMTQVVRLAARVRTYNLIVTNVPGPQMRLHLLRAPLLAAYPMVPLFTNQAVGIALISYHGRLFWGINSDWDRVPDLHDLAEALNLEFEELRKVLQSPSSRSRKQEAAPRLPRS